MAERLDLSIDLETLGATKEKPGLDEKYAPVEEKSKIIQIGLTIFDPFVVSDEGELLESSWFENIDHDQPGRIETESTKQWWNQQDPKVWDDLCQNQVHIEDALKNFLLSSEEYISKHTRLWFRGDAFDNTILRDALAQYCLELRIPFWNVRDVRSVEELTFGKGVQAKYRFGDHHNAMYDAMSQARLVQECFRRTENVRSGGGQYPDW